MSNRRRAQPRIRPTLAGTPIAAIARFTGESPKDVQAAIVELMTDGFTFDEIWDLLGAIPQGGKVVDMAAEHLGTRK